MKTYLRLSNVLINQISIVPVSPREAPGSVARQPNQCSAAILIKQFRKQFRNINGPSGVLMSMGERSSQRDVPSDVL